jgi:hypothetical protein
MNRTTESLTFKVLLSFEAHALAEQHRQQHNQPQKAKQVYLNSLAQYAVDFYCRCMGWETELEAIDSHHPLMQKFMDVADLNVKHLGKLECRPVLPNSEVMEVPPDVWDNRIGYVAVQLNSSLKQAILLGFVPSVAHQQGIIPLSELRSLADFPAYLSEFSQVPDTKLQSNVVDRTDLGDKDDKEEKVLCTNATLYEQTSPQLVNLHNWLEGIVEAGWQSIDELFATRQVSLASAFRSRTLRFRGKTKQELIQILQTTQDEETRWQAAEILWELDPNHPASGVRRVVDLGFHLAGYAVALMVAVLPKRDRSMAILLRVYPLASQSHLPPGLQLIVLDEMGNTFSEVPAREQDNYIQFKFTADSGDRFSAKVTLDEASITENFLV